MYSLVDKLKICVIITAGNITFAEYYFKGGIKIMGLFGKNLSSEEMKALSEALLNSIRPNLKAPTTATLCEANQLVMTPIGEGIYKVEGYVYSQNGYGAMISTDFSANATLNHGHWEIRNIILGTKKAKNFAKNFIVWFIILSIFTTLAGLMGYWILSSIVG